MILYKTIALTMGRHLENEQFVELPGPDGIPITPDEARQHWKNTLSEFSNARIYLLDHNAADYLDSLRMDVQGMPWQSNPESHIQNYVRNVAFPNDLVWVEYDDRKLWEGRVERGITTMDEEELGRRKQRGFLFDNRSNHKLTVRLYSAYSEKIFFDAPFILEIAKTSDGRPDFSNVSWHMQRPAIAVLMRLGLIKSGAALQEAFEEHKGRLTYEMVIGFMLFAALSNREDDLQSIKTPSLTNAQMKTARKFGKAWMTNTLKSHVTIRIGPAAQRHLSEQKARIEFEKVQSASRSAPTEHWVSEHERRYRDGKIVRIKAHKRGKAADKNLPARVIGPSEGR